MDSGDPVTVGFIGRLNRYKGLDRFVAVADRAADGYPWLRFRVDGDGPGAAEVAEAARRLPNLEAHLGWIDDDDFERRMSSYDLLLLPYREASQSGVLAHALTLGLPVIATDVGGLVQQIAETGCGQVVDRPDVTRLLEATVALAADPDRMAEYSAAGR